jgi:hypothetical protein
MDDYKVLRMAGCRVGGMADCIVWRMADRRGKDGRLHQIQSIKDG